MPSEKQDNARRAPQRAGVATFLSAAALVAAAGFAVPETSAAAEMKLLGSGTFKPPAAEQLAALPADLGFSQTDLASGTWTFSVRYDDSVLDADSDPGVGRYSGVIRAFRLVIGGTTVDLPVEQAVIAVSDGGGGFPNRESIRVETKASTSSGLLRVSWVQINQQPKGIDLRGPAGALPSDALPTDAMVAHLPTTSPFDRYLELRIDRPGGDSHPLLYLSSSKLSVTSGPATAP